jgi:hypothetical protein
MANKQITIKVNPSGVDAFASDLLIAREEKFHCNMAVRELAKKSRSSDRFLPELHMACRRFAELQRRCLQHTEIAIDLLDDFGTRCEETGARMLMGCAYYMELEADGRTLHVRMCVTAG